MIVFVTKPRESDNSLEKWNEIKKVILHSLDTLIVCDINSPRAMIRGYITFYMPIPQEDKVKLGIEDGYIFSCGINNYYAMLSKCKGDEWSEDLHGQMYMQVSIVQSFENFF